MFKESDKVVCVDDSPGKITGLKLLNRGTVYVVQKPANDGHTLVLVGIDITFLGSRIGFCDKRFRLLNDPVDRLVSQWIDETVAKTAL